MRSIVPFVLWAWCGTTGAQPVLEYSSMPVAPYVLDWYVVTDLGTATMPTDGAAQTWNFTSVTLQFVGTATLMAASGTPYASQYPDANWAFEYHPDGTSTYFYNYSLVDATGVQTYANEIPVNPEVYIDPKRIVAFPFTYGDSFSDLYQVQGDVPHTVTRSYTGYGTANTPLGTMSGLVKVSSSEGGAELYSSDPFYPAVLINTDNSVFVFAPHSTGVLEAMELRTLAIMPSITADGLRVELPAEDGPINWHMMKVTGGMVRSGTTRNVTVLNLDVSDLSPGLYSLVVEGRTQRSMGRFIRE